MPKQGAILVGAPHTSNWDFVLMLAIAGQVGITYRWLGKNSLFRFPLGPVLRRLGGIPVNRDAKNGLVSALAEEMREANGEVLAMTPKGTRKQRKYWKSGFYRIAEEANLPLILGFVDSATKTTGLGPVIDVSGDVFADMEKIRSFYAGKLGIRPELTSVPRLRAEQQPVDNDSKEE